MAKILHVTECYDGGVSSAIRKVIDLTPEHEHFLLLDGEDTTYSASVKEVTRFRTGDIVRRTLEVRRRVAVLQPDYVHLHSSWAGAYGRLLPIEAPVIYQPHCYKFDDASLTPLKRWIFRSAERLLSARSDTTVVLSPHEARLSQELNSAVDCLYVPNVPSCNLSTRSTTSAVPEDGSRRVVMVGRICRQKDPLFFAEIAKLAGRSPVLSGWVFRWVGDGDDDLRSTLLDCGVEVAGWKQGPDLLAELDAGDYYVHSASYEGFPISVLDAAARGLPIVARAIDALDGSPIYQVATAADVVDALERAEVEPGFQQFLLNQSSHLLEARTEADQGRAWMGLYASSEVESA